MLFRSDNQCGGSGMLIPDPGSDFFHPGSRIRTVSILDPGSSSKNLSILTPKKQKKWSLSSKKYDPGCSSRIRMLTFSHPGSRIRMLTFSHPGSRIQGSKRHPISDPGSATLLITTPHGTVRYSQALQFLGYFVFSVGVGI